MTWLLPADSDQGCVSAECPRNLFTARSGRTSAQDMRPVPPAISLLPKDGCASGLRHRRRIETTRTRAERPAHPSNRLVAQLNATWRVMDDPLQWRLQRRKGNPRKKNSGWRDRSFCTTREGLLRCVREYCGDVEPAALAKLTALPEHYAMQNLDVRGTDQAHANGQSKPLVSQALEDCEAGDQPPRNSQPALS